jgi:4-hydroxyphenylpyruvate dioxygenase-like putative hemolysin
MNNQYSYSHHLDQRFPKLKGYDYIEFYVGNAFLWAHFYQSALGFKMTARAGLETGIRDRVSILLEQNDIRLLLTAAQGPDSPIAQHVSLHATA